MNNDAILECPRCLNMFVAWTMKLRSIGEKLRSVRCRCGNTVEFDFDYMDPVQLRAQPNVANRIRKIYGYAVRIEGLTYEKRVPG